jgi:hypothetical protein
MLIKLQICTGNPKPPPELIEWQLDRTDAGVINLYFAERDAVLQPPEWSVFVTVVKKRSPHKWVSNKPIPELSGNQNARQLLRGCQDTPHYQVLLAGIDIAHNFKMTESLPPDDLHTDFAKRNHTIKSIFGPGGIYFVPDEVVGDNKTQYLMELLKTNKLGQAQLTVTEREVTRYYIPYATPSTLQQTMSPQANQLWDTIRKEYYHFRHPLRSLPG